jgi:tetratricopeptide (TPR) repeat protein
MLLRRLSILAAALACLGGPPAIGPARADTLDEVRAGNAAFGEGRYEAAVGSYTRAILAGDLEPEALAVTFNNRGVAYSELGDYDRAIQDYNQALTLRPEDKTSIKNLRIGHSRRAASYANLGEHDQALADYAKAIELDPGHAPTYVRRAQLRLDRGDAGAALADLGRARELDPSNREAGQLLARAEAAVAAERPPEDATTADAGATASVGAAGSPAEGGQGWSPSPAAGPPQDAAAKTAALAAPEVPAAPTSPEGGLPPAAEGGAPRPLPPVTVAEREPQPFRTVQAVNYREGPGNDYPRSGTLAGGTTITVVGESGGWLKFRLRSGKEGFVYRRWLEPAPPG